MINYLPPFLIELRLLRLCRFPEVATHESVIGPVLSPHPKQLLVFFLPLIQAAGLRLIIYFLVGRERKKRRKTKLPGKFCLPVHRLTGILFQLPGATVENKEYSNNNALYGACNSRLFAPTGGWYLAFKNHIRQAAKRYI